METNDAITLMITFSMFVLALLSYLKKKIDRPLAKVCGLL